MEVVRVSRCASIAHVIAAIGLAFRECGRPPEIQRNSQPGPGVRNIDFRITREIPIHEGMHMEIIGEAFNLLNQEEISSTNTTFAALSAPSGATGACPTVAGLPSGTYFEGCIGPFVAPTHAGAFGVKTGTNSLLYGPRQMQLSAKFFF